MRHGSQIDPPNRFARTRIEFDDADPAQSDGRRIEYFEDQSKSIVASNDSPDIPFRFSVNPYRGCAHGCSYCYARPTHEYLGFNAGLDFETKVMVKLDAPRLFRNFLARPGWQCEAIAFSGVTDCYQPAERRFQLTRQCLQIALAARQPIGLVTKNALVQRDTDLLAEMAAMNLVHVFVSITTLDAGLAGDMEPRTSTPQARFRAIEQLTQAGVPVGVMVAPIIPGLNDSEVPAILAAAAEAGATTAGHVLLRLPSTVAPVFQEWLLRTRPLQAEKILQRIRQTRDGKINQSSFQDRMTGCGPIAEQIQAMVRLFKRKYGLDQPLPAYDHDRFIPPPPERDHDQPLLF
jgi:DNA repair photolyase